MSETFPEAGAVAFTSFKRTDGFIVNLTLRDENGTKVIERLNKAIELIKTEGGTPVENRGGMGKTPTNSKPCPIHTDLKLYERTGKDGKTFFSHKDGNRWCNGKPPKQQEQSEYPDFNY